MGAAPSVCKVDKTSAALDAHDRREYSYNSYLFAQSTTQVPKKSEVNKKGKRQSKHGNEPFSTTATAAAKAQRGASRERNLSDPISPPVREQRTSDATNYSIFPMEASMPLRTARAAAAVAPAAPLTNESSDSWGFSAPLSPSVLHRTPEVQPNNFRRLVTKANLKANADIQRRCSAKPIENRRNTGTNTTNPPLSSEGEGMLWLEQNAPAVPEEQPSRRLRDGVKRREYSFFGHTPGAEREEEGDAEGYNFGDVVFGAGAAAWNAPATPIAAVLTPRGTSPTAAATATARRFSADSRNSNANRKGGQRGVYGSMVPSTISRASSSLAGRAVAAEPEEDAVRLDGEGENNVVNITPPGVTGVARRDTFGFLMPYNKSFVIGSGGLSSAQRREKANATKKDERRLRGSPNDCVDFFLMAHDAREDINAGAADRYGDFEDVVHNDPRQNERQQHQQRQTSGEGTTELCVSDKPATFDSTRSPRPAVAVAPPPSPLKCGAPRHSCPMPQPDMFGPRKCLTRSRPFDVERLLGFSMAHATRVRSPDWRRVSQLGEAHSLPHPAANQRQHHQTAQNHHYQHNPNRHLQNLW